jgi:hypothetical protein
MSCIDVVDPETERIMILANTNDVHKLDTEAGWAELHDWWNSLPATDVRKEVHGIIDDLMTDIMFSGWIDPGHNLTLTHMFDRDLYDGGAYIGVDEFNATMDRLKALTLDQGWYPSYGSSSEWYAVGVPAAVPIGVQPSSDDISNFRWGTFVVPGLTSGL